MWGLVDNIGVARDHPALDRSGAGYGIDHTPELDEQAVAGRLDDPAMVGCDRGVDQTFPMSLQGAQRSDLVDTHEAAVPGHIHGQDSRQSPLHMLLFHRYPFR